MKVVLTAADLVKPRLEPQCNPVAKAIARAMAQAIPPQAASIQTDGANVALGYIAWRLMPLPPVAQKALELMAAGQRVEPFEFHLPDAFVTLPRE